MKLDYLSDGSLLRYSSRLGVYYFFCEHFPLEVITSFFFLDILSDDDIIIFDNFGYDGTDGIYAINYKGAGFVKRLQRDKDCVKIISDNKIYEPMFENGESEDFRIVGKVRYVVHKVLKLKIISDVFLKKPLMLKLKMTGRNFSLGM